MMPLLFPLLALTLVAAVLARLKIPYAEWLAAISGSLFIWCLGQVVMAVLIYCGVVPFPWGLDYGYLRLGIMYAPSLAVAVIFFCITKPRKLQQSSA